MFHPFIISLHKILFTLDGASENSNVPTSHFENNSQPPLELPMHYPINLDRNLHFPSLEPQNVSDLRYESHMRTSAIAKKATP
jgi:hypothetical protein